MHAIDIAWKIDLFGRLSVSRETQEITHFRTQKTGALLAYLAYYRLRSHTREELTSLFWPEDDPVARGNSFRVALNSLRRQLEPDGVPPGMVIVADRASVRLNPAACITDVAEFEAALREEMQAPTDAERLPLLTTVVELYRGELLPGYYDWWVEGERQRLADAYLGALRRLVKFLAQARDFDRALDYARRAVNVDPLREESHRLLMRLYITVGRPTAAISQYRELERLLKEGLGTSPAAATRELIDPLMENSVPVRTPDPAPGNAGPIPMSVSLSISPTPTQAASGGDHVLPGVVGHLPLPLTRFFGCQEELAQLLARLQPCAPSPVLCTPDGTGLLTNGALAARAEEAESRAPLRLVTLTGPGGAGKTRLAMEVARRLQEAYHGAVWFVPLADLRDPGRIACAIVDALRLRRAALMDPIAQIVEALSGRPALLVLDNFEQLLQGPYIDPDTGESRFPPAGIDLFEDEGVLAIRTLLERLPALTCLVTSRQRLNVAGEQEFPLLPLPTPLRPDTLERLQRFASVQLFVDRAQAVQPGFQVTPDNAASVGALCRCLEGLPLAIELAAAWVPTLTPAQMLAQLERRFDLLVSRQKDLSLRHRTLRAAIDWSYRLLSPALQRFFVRLSVFRGEWTFEAAAAICLADGPEGAGVDPRQALTYLAQLRECSLVVTKERQGVMRFRMLETLREYAAEQLDAAEREALARRHAAYFLRLAEEAEPYLNGAEQAEWLERLETEHDNLRAALAWSLGEAGNREKGKGKREEDPSFPFSLRSFPLSEVGLRLVAALAWFWEIRGYVSEGRAWLAEALSRPELRSPTDARARALNGAGRLAYCQKEFRAAEAFYRECLDIRRQLGDRKGAAITLNQLGSAVASEGRCEETLALYTEALAEHCAVGDRAGEATTLNSLGFFHYVFRDSALARAYLEASMAIRQELGDTLGIGIVLINLGVVAQEEGDYAAARACLSESLSLMQKLVYRRGIAGGLERLAGLAAVQGQWERAARLFAAADAMCEVIHCTSPATLFCQYATLLQSVRDHLGAPDFATEWEQGRHWAWEEAVSYAFDPQ